MQADEAASQEKLAELEAELEKLTADAAATEKLLKGDAQRASNEALSARMEAVRAKVRLSVPPYSLPATDLRSQHSSDDSLCRLRVTGFLPNVHGDNNRLNFESMKIYQAHGIRFVKCSNETPAGSYAAAGPDCMRIRLCVQAEAEFAVQNAARAQAAAEDQRSQTQNAQATAAKYSARAAELEVNDPHAVKYV